MKDNDAYQLWVDGSGRVCTDGKFINGWGAVLLKNGEIFKHSAGFVIEYKKRRFPIFEALALYNGLMLLDDEDDFSSIKIFSDSDVTCASVIRICNAMFNFSESKRRKKRLRLFVRDLNLGKSFDNYLLEIFDLLILRNINHENLKVVKSHSNLKYNDLADELASLSSKFPTETGIAKRINNESIDSLANTHRPFAFY